ncbi:MAG: hypothetical protein JNL11_10745 [Bdellovibrionaceae bacterium]|nr:hypothetical protein [Pseudobdellovibrionaceae bacterium]
MNIEKILGTPDLVWKQPYTMQGDVIIKQCGDFDSIFEVSHEIIPSEAKPVPGNLVLKGQTNSHALYGGKFQLYEHEGTLFIRVEEPTVLDHVKDHTRGQEKAEHHGQWIPVGEYFVDSVQEFDHLLEESRKVID